MRIKSHFTFIWLTLTFSFLGNAVLAFGLGIWLYQQTHQALSSALGVTFLYLPAFFLTPFVKRCQQNHSPESILNGANFCEISLWGITTTVIILSHQVMAPVYTAFFISGCLKAFQTPALPLLIKAHQENQLQHGIGLFSLSNAAINLISPLIGLLLLKQGGLNALLLFNLISYPLVSVALMTSPKMPDSFTDSENANSSAQISAPLFHLYPQISLLIVSTAIMSLLSHLTYESILSPMILARSHEPQTSLVIVNSFLGIGSLIGGVLVNLHPLKSWALAKYFYLCAALSFLFGDGLMALGQTSLIWAIGALAASIPMPIVTTASQLIIFKDVTSQRHGEVFAKLNAGESLTIPLGTFLGGWLADHLFTPLLTRPGSRMECLHQLVGTTAGSGMTVMFLATSLLGSLWCVWAYMQSQKVKKNTLSFKDHIHMWDVIF